MERAPRLIASDIDGTFLDRNHRVTKRNRDVVVRAVAAGAHFALSTGRPFRWIAPVLDQLPLRPLCVTSNGAVIYDPAADAVVLAHELQPDTLAELADVALTATARYGGVGFGAERAGASASDAVDELFVVDPVYARNDIFMEGFGLHDLDVVTGSPAVKFIIRNPHLSSHELYELIAPHVDAERAHVTYSMDDGLLEVAAPGVTKAHGVAWLADHYGVARDEIVAFGDMPNDIEMLQWVGYGVAMGNAADSVKEAADYVTEPNHQGGVAKVLERWF
ncbi:HAD family hydrolase [uncultured Corynebacterium sp.]|uniref:HAD family hydrolase n=1 Tax=uncultured Corynebacterium sp. TaxID=159447 RepID=UPI0025EE07AF|nr:HAD family hydrolase [uncultured Corynebacterium sp.]